MELIPLTTPFIALVDFNTHVASPSDTLSLCYNKDSVSFHTKVREFCSLGINPKICPKETTVNTNPNNQSQSTVVPRDTVAPCLYVYRHSGVHTV